MERDKTWYETRVPILDNRVRARLVDLSIRLATPTGSTTGSAPVTC